MSRRRKPEPACPCGLGPYAACCGRYLDDGAEPASPELLMRSRYTAYVRQDRAHLSRTWHPSTRPDPLVLTSGLRWTGLEVVSTSGGGLLEPEGTVHFRASAVVDGRREVLDEHSRFVRDDGRWRYLEAITSRRA